MFSMIKSENLKYKRTFSKKLIYTAPLFFILYAIITIDNIKSKNNYFEYTVFNWWPLIFIPLGISLVCALSVVGEKKSGNYRNLRCYDISIRNLWLSKIIVIASYTLFASIELVLLLYMINIFIPGSISSITEVSNASFVIWITSLSLIPIGLFFSELLGTVASIVINAIGTTIGVIIASESFWICIPWSWSMRLMSPIIGVHPNGIPLNENSKLLDPSVIPLGISVSVIVFIILSLITSLWFSKKEVS